MSKHNIFDLTNREKIEEYLYHETIEVRTNEELAHYLVNYMDIFSEMPCEFCSCKKDPECIEISDCVDGVIKWLEEDKEAEE